MFIQVIQGKTKDAAGLRQQLDRWEQDIQPGAKGYLGSTGGVAKDGTVFELVRFKDEASARANSDRTEQGAWWNETSKYFEGDVRFTDSSDVDEGMGGGNDKAGFVQIMQGHTSDRKRMTNVEEKFRTEMTKRRPDLLGMVRVWNGDDFTQAVYFKSEAEARKAESSMADSGETPPPEFQEFMSLMEVTTYIDLTDPWLRSAK
jgi:hypothetical protein